MVHIPMYMPKVVMAIMVFCNLFTPGTGFAVACPNHLTTSFSKTADDVRFDSSYILPDNPGIVHGIGNLNLVPLPFRNITYEDVSTVKSCDDFRRYSHSVYAFYPMNVASTCPWYYRKNIDDNRVPRVIMEAKCACRCCNKADRHTCRRQSDSKCGEVYHYAKVLRRFSCTDVREIVEPIAVGCSCIEFSEPRSQSHYMPMK